MSKELDAARELVKMLEEKEKSNCIKLCHSMDLYVENLFKE